MVTIRLNALAAINHHLRAVDETALVTGKIQTHVGDIIRLRETAQRHISNELLSVLRGVFHTSEHGKQTRSRE